MVVEAPDKAHGLQVEVDPRNESGGIYESYRRNWVSKPTKASQLQYFQPDQWNELEITALGGDVTVKTNGIVSAQLRDDPSRPAGQLAMQMHSGDAMRVLFKDIQIRPVTGEDTLRRTATQPTPVRPNDRGELILAARSATADGTPYLPAWDALVLPAGTQVSWELADAQPGSYDVSLEWSAPADFAAGPLMLTAGDEQLTSEVASTGSSDIYRIQQLGRLTVAAGTPRIHLQPTPPGLHLRELRLVPVQAP